MSLFFSGVKGVVFDRFYSFFFFVCSVDISRMSFLTERLGNGEGNVLSFLVATMGICSRVCS